ncbi:MAG: glycosyltransferase [Sciscionella sp.]
MSIPPSTVPVLAVLVCHDGETWLRQALSALRRQSPRPRHLLAVDTGSTDRTPELLAEALRDADAVLDGVLDCEADTGFGAAVAVAVDHAVQRWGDPGEWLWLLHDDCAPEPDCLQILLDAAQLSPSVGVLGPLALSWSDARLVVEAGLSTDAGGHLQTGIAAAELDWSRFPDTGDDQRFQQRTEVLAVSSAGSLIRRELWSALGGFDTALPMLRDDLDFGWRANLAGTVVLCVPEARMRHAMATGRGLRQAAALRGHSVLAADRAHGVRTFLVNCGRLSFLLGLPRLAALCLLRALAFGLIHRTAAARAELRTFGYLLSGRAGLRAARQARGEGISRGSVHGLLTSRATRLRNALQGSAASLVRRRVAAEAALGRLPAEQPRNAVWVAPEGAASRPRLPTGPAALPAGALGRTGAPRRAGGLRRPTGAVVVPVPPARPPPDGRPSPGPAQRDGLMLVEMDRSRVLKEILLAPPVVLTVLLTAIALVANSGRLAPALTGGRLLALPSLGGIWSEYLATWHGVAGGTAAPAPAALAVLGILGTPFGSPSLAVTVLLLGDAPIAGLIAYFATRRMPVARWVRALAGAGYALLPPATAAVAQGRLDAVVVHLLLPAVLAGVAGVLVPAIRLLGRASWLSGTVLTALGLALLGAFSPLAHLMVLAIVLLGFVLVPSVPGEGRRRVVSLFAMVLLPLLLLLPWPAVELQHPALVLFGVGARPDGHSVSAAELATLTPEGAGAWPYVGALVLVAVLVAVVLRPRRAMLPGFGVVILGAGVTVALAMVTMVPVGGTRPQHAWSGPALLMAGAGLLWMLLAACGWSGEPRSRALGHKPVAVLAAVGVLALLGLAAGEVIAGGSGPLRAGTGPRLADTVRNELADTGGSVLVMAHDGQPVRQSAGRMPEFGDDDLPPVGDTTVRLRTWDRQLRGTSTDAAKQAVAQAGAAGVVFVVLPDRQAASRLRAAVGDAVSPLPRTTDGRPVVRLRSSASVVTLYSPELSRRAVTGAQPPIMPAAQGVAPVRAVPPDVAVRVSEGSRGRMLVLAAEDEPGWRATINNRPAPITRAWGHQVGVVVPQDASDVRVFQSSTLRDVLLLLQAAALLFTVLTAIPTRRS